MLTLPEKHGLRSVPVLKRVLVLTQRVLVLLLALGICLTSVRANDHADDPVEKAVRVAQQRVVKVYGAKVGRTPGYASGVIVSPDGKILTAGGTYLNGQRVRVILADGSVNVATVERRSRELQLAILRIKVKTPRYFDLSKAAEIKKGDWVLAITNAFKIADGAEELSVSLGVVALKTRLEARRGTQPFRYQGEVFLLDSITSNPGSPGGAVIDTTGQLAGIIGPNLENDSTGTRVNYAIPVEVVRQFIEGGSSQPIARASTNTNTNPFVGIRLFKLGGADGPAYVDRVLADSPAAEAGFRPDDLILALGDERIKSVRQYEDVLKTLAPGKEIVVTAKRKQSLIQIKLTPTAAMEGGR